MYLTYVTQLLFDEDNALHKSEKWLFSTEGHILKVQQDNEYGECPTNGSCPGQCFPFTRQHHSLPMPAEYMIQTETAIGLRTS